MAGCWALVLVTLGGCSDESGGTRIVVTVDTDIAEDAKPGLTEVVISVTGGPKEAKATADVEAGETLPRQLILTHEGGALGPFVVTATGTLSNDGILTQTAREVFFVKGEAVTLELSLDADCIDVCEGESCTEGECMDVVQMDGGMADSGPSDSGNDDAGDGGANPADSGADAMEGGGPDAGDAAECQGDEDCDALDMGCTVGVCGADGYCVAEPLVDGTSCGSSDYCIDGSCIGARDCRNGTCALDCRGNAICTFDCTDASVCGVSCAGSACVVDCTAALLDCDQIDCTKGSCLLECAEATSCAFASCYGAQEACGDGSIVVCGRTCPE